MSEFMPTELLVNIPDKVLPDPDEISYYILEKERKSSLQESFGESNGS